MRFILFPDPILKPVFATLLALAVAFGFSTPRPAVAQDGIAGAVALGIVGTAVYCAANPHRCGGSRTGTTSGNLGAVDAAALNRTQAMWVQGGLRNLGFYSGAIDGAIGAGTRSSIRQYQAAIGANATGRLTGQQINDLVALSPDFISYEDDAPYLFNAGPVDGAMGGMTRNAIAAYKGSQGLPGGPVASRRLLAHMLDMPAPVPAGAHLVAFRPSGSSGGEVDSSSGNTAQNVAQPQADTPAAPEGEDLVFDLLGVTLGMKPDAVTNRLSQEFGANLVTDQTDAAGFGGTEGLDIAYLGQQSNWPADAAEQFVALFDSARPDLGAVAAFRTIRMPASVDQAMFDAQVMPGILEKYGADARFGDDDIWIGGADARAAARDDAGILAQCGELRLADIGSGSWAEGSGPRLDTASLDSVSRDCGQVLTVTFENSVLEIGLWNSTALSGAAPKIKF
jgi:peptidoglycan hydrolase-like protein with peptidoglycan-binding domain